MLRVGITGTREIDASRADTLREQLREVLAVIRQEVGALASTPSAQFVYGPAATPQLRFLSPLAEGADRLAADVALQLGYALHVPMPFPREQYAKDFVHEADPAASEASRASFDRLAASPATLLELDGGGADDQDASYEAVGRYVARNADLLIAIWDGRRARGRGGSGDIVRFAVRSGVPVWWIPLDPGAAHRLLRTPHELRDPGTAPTGPDATRALAALLHRAVVPPQAPPPHAHGKLGRVVHWLARRMGQSRDPLLDYLAESNHVPATRWPLFSRCITLLAGPAPEGPRMLAPEGPIESYWHQSHQAADALSNAYGDRYRSSYLLIFLFAFTAVVCTVFFPLGHRAALWGTAIEFLLLFGIATLVVCNHLRRWHERWISYRLLAELCRKQQALAPLGWSLPNWEIERLAATGDLDAHGGLPRDAWVAWYFTALRRAAPLPTGLITPVIDRARKVGRSLLAEQIGYHDTRCERSAMAARRLGTWGEACFGLTLLAVAVKFWLLREHANEIVIVLLDVAATLFPAASAALFGIRAYSEFELLAHQSHCMRQSMRAAVTELDGLPTDRPLLSQEIGAQLYSVAIAMLQDIAGWAQLFRMKMVETT